MGGYCRGTPMASKSLVRTVPLLLARSIARSRNDNRACSSRCLEISKQTFAGVRLYFCGFSMSSDHRYSSLSSPGSHSLISLKRDAEPDDKPIFVHYRASRGEAYRDCRRYSCGVMPVSALKARLNGPIEPNPQSSAIVRIGKWASAGSTRRRFASSMR